MPEQEEKTSRRYGPDSPTDKSVYPLTQKFVNEMIVGLCKFDGITFASPDASTKTTKIYEKRSG